MLTNLGKSRKLVSELGTVKSEVRSSKAKEKKTLNKKRRGKVF